MWEIKADPYLTKYVNIKLDIIINEFSSGRCTIDMPKDHLMVHEVIWCTNKLEAFAIIKKKFGKKVHENLGNVVKRYIVQTRFPLS